MLRHLHRCAVNGIVVVGYHDRATAVMTERSDGSGCFAPVPLAPGGEIARGSDSELASALHADAHRICLVAGSVNFPVEHRPEITVRGT